MITYTRAKTKKLKIDVRCDGKVLGAIKQTTSRMFFYQPKGSKTTGEPFATLAECKASLCAA